MNRTVLKENFFKYLHSHPAAVKKLINPSDELLVECLKTNSEVMEFIPKGKQNETIILGFIINNPRSYKVQDYLNNNKELVTKLSLDIIKMFIKIDPHNIKYFPQATKELWIETSMTSLSGIDYKCIPENVLCEELLTNIITGGYIYPNFIGAIPERFWTESLIRTALNKEGYLINHLPESVLTKERVMFAITKGLNELKIPEGLWDVEIAEAASEKVGLDNIPSALRSKNVCLKSIYSNQFRGIEYIPSDLLKDVEVQIAYICKANSAYIETEIPNIKKESFLLKALQTIINRTPDPKIEVGSFLGNIKGFIKDWIPIIKLWPEALILIQKPDQTPDMILTALSNRTERDNLEMIGKSINLARVSKEMAPMLLNVEDVNIKDFITRKFAPPKRADGAGVDEVLMDLTPQEFKEINKGV
jgi:hypothetical protein